MDVGLTIYLEAFRKRWVDAFKEQVQSPRLRPKRPWQGAEACSELKRRGFLFLVLPNPKPGNDGDFPFDDLTLRLASAIQAYKQCIKDVADANKCFNDGIGVLF